jgi:hypothetical protein
MGLCDIGRGEIRGSQGSEDVSEEHTASIFRAEAGQYVSPKHWYLPESPHDVTTQNTNMEVVRAKVCQGPVLVILVVFCCSHGDTDS